MSNTNKWIELLKGKNNYEAFKIIWSPDRPLTGKQRQALVKLHRQINGLFTPEDSEWWNVKED